MDVQKQIDGLTKQIKDYVHGAGKKGVVIGMSGGIDSAVSFELAIKALGADNVFAVSIPILANTGEEFSSASDMWGYVWEKCGVRHVTAHASSPVIATTSAVEKALGHKLKNNLTYANIQARERMNVLYAFASELDYLVIGTGNKSEHKIGYFTKWGDGGVDFEPLGAYYKDEVYELGRALYVPGWILNAAPSAGLWEGQTDENEIGMSYDELDSYLRWDEFQNSLFEFDEENGKNCPLSPEKQKIVVKLMGAANHKNKMPPTFERSE